MATAYEKAGERDAVINGDKPEWTLNFCVLDAANEYEAYDAVMAIAPVELFGTEVKAVRQPPKIKLEGGNTWTAEVKYVVQELSEIPDPTGGEPTVFKLDFDTGGETFTRYAVASDKQTRYYVSDTSFAPDIKGALGFDGKKASGIEQVIPGLKLTVTAEYDATRITANRIKEWSRVTGKINSDAFLGFAAGELLNLGAKGSLTIDSYSLTAMGKCAVSFVFMASENITTSQKIGEIDVPRKDGWQHVDVVNAPYDDGGVMVSKPLYVYVSDVYESTSFRAFTQVR